MIVLHDYFRSGASHRVRIGLNLKGAAYERRAVDLRVGAQKAPVYTALNPQGLAPTLVTDDGAALTQSLAILEWLDETIPSPPFLPQDAMGRARVRAIADIVACDIHPLGNLRVVRWLQETAQCDDARIKAFMAVWVKDGFDAIETLIAQGPGGPWCWGSAPTLADICVAPQIYAARSRYDFDMAPYPRLRAVEAAAAEHPAFQQAHPEAK